MRYAILALLALGACSPAALTGASIAYDLGCASAPVLIEADPLPNDDRGEAVYRWACPEQD